MIHAISHIENRLDSDDELRIECHGDIEIYVSRERFLEMQEVFTQTVAIEATGVVELRQQLRMAVTHLKHMAAWISKDNRGYSFEALGEDMPTFETITQLAKGSE